MFRLVQDFRRRPVRAWPQLRFPPQLHRGCRLLRQHQKAQRRKSLRHDYFFFNPRFCCWKWNTNGICSIIIFLNFFFLLSILITFSSWFKKRFWFYVANNNSVWQGFSNFFVWRPFKNIFKIMRPNIFFGRRIQEGPPVPPLIAPPPLPRMHLV